jgi:hypothetical protein
LDEKYKTTSFFVVRLLKCPFEKKINLKNTPKKRHRFEKKKRERKRKGKKKKNSLARWDWQGGASPAMKQRATGR